MSWFGLVWDLQAPPESVLKNEKRTTHAIIERTAGHIASGFSVETLVAQVRQAWSNSPHHGHHMDELKARAQKAWSDAESYLKSIELPSLPSREEMQLKARKKFANTPSLDVAAERAREQLAQRVAARLLEDVRRELPLAA